MNQEREVITKKKNSVPKNYFYNVIFQIFLIIVPFVVTPYVSRVLHPEGVGQYGFTYSIITFFVIIGSLGFGTYAQREIAKFQGNKQAQSIIFWEIILVRTLPVLVSLILNGILILIGVYGEYSLLMKLLSINIIAVAFDIAFYYQGNEQFGKIVIRNVIIKLFGIIGIFLFVKSVEDVWVYALINSFILIVSNLSLWLDLPKRITRVSRKELNIWRHMPGTLRLFIPTIATMIYTVLNRALLGFLIHDTYTVIEDGIEKIKKISDLENGYYEQAEKIVKLAMTIITSIGIVMIPRNTNEVAVGNMEKVKSNIYLSSKLVWLLGVPLSIGIACTASNFVPWFLGEGYEKSILLIQVFSPMIIIIGFSNVLGLQYLVPMGKDIRFSIALLSGALVNAIVCFVLIPNFMSLGAVVGSLSAELFVTTLMFLMVRKEISIKTMLGNLWKYLLAGVMMAIPVYFLSINLEPKIINTIIIILSGVFFYFLSLLCLKENLLTTMLKKKKIG